MEPDSTPIYRGEPIVKLQPLAIMLFLLGGLACLSSVYNRLEMPTAIAAAPSPTTTPSTTSNVTAWDYHLVRLPIFFEPATELLDNTVLGTVEDKNTVAQFRQLGLEGWELVAIANGVAVFKRPR